MWRYCERIIEHRRQEPMKFAVGMVVSLKDSPHITGVIVSWDSWLTKDYESYERMHHAVTMPFFTIYTVLKVNGDLTFVLEGSKLPK